MESEGTSSITVAPAATIELLPIETPSKIVELAPIYVFSPIVTPPESTAPLDIMQLLATVES